MPRYHDSRLIPYPQKEVFNIVRDVERYPEFVPWCKAVTVKERKNNHLIVDLTAGNDFLSETYTSDVYLTPYSKIEVSQNKGPFKYLSNIWEFKEHPTGTEISFLIEFEFKSFFFQKAIESVFMETATRMIQAFDKRIRTLYDVPHLNRQEATG